MGLQAVGVRVPLLRGAEPALHSSRTAQDPTTKPLSPSSRGSSLRRHHQEGQVKSPHPIAKVKSRFRCRHVPGNVAPAVAGPALPGEAPAEDRSRASRFSASSLAFLSISSLPSPPPGDAREAGDARGEDRSIRIGEGRSALWLLGEEGDFGDPGVALPGVPPRRLARSRASRASASSFDCLKDSREGEAAGWGGTAAAARVGDGLS